MALRFSSRLGPIDLIDFAESFDSTAFPVFLADALLFYFVVGYLTHSDFEVDLLTATMWIGATKRGRFKF